MPTLNELSALSRPPGSLSASTSLFPSAMGTVVECILPLSTVLSDIQNGRWAAAVSAVREALAQGNRERADHWKKRLPAFTASALLRTRARDAGPRVITHSGWLQADFDAKDHPGLSQAEARRTLQDDPSVGAVFVGPSGGGIKALVHIDPARHAGSVDAAIRHFRERHGLRMDPACRDVERLCFISHDPLAWQRAGETTILPLPDPAPSETPSSSPVRPSSSSPSSAPAPARTADSSAPPLLLEWKMEDVREVLRFLPKQRPDYDTWLRVISGVSSVLPMAEAVRCLQEWSPPEQPGEYEAKWRHRLHHVTIRSVIRMAQAGGFDAAGARRRQRWMGRLVIGGQRPGAPPPDHADLLTEDPEPSGPSAWDTWKHLKDQQMGDATIFAARLGHVWKHDILTKRWRHYGEATGLWTQDLAGSVTLEAREAAVDSYAGLIETICNEKAANKNEDEVKRLEAEIRELNARMANLGKSAWCAGLMSFAEKMPALLCRAPDFDRSRHLLAVANGVLDFHTNQFLDFDKAHRLASAAPVEYRPGAECPAFDAFLETCMGGDAELIAYLWRAIGYSLTGFVDHDALFFCYGTGANGKSTFFLVMQMLLGESLATVIDISTLLGGSPDSGGTQDYKKSMLEGKRLVMTDEIPDDRRFNESMIKQLLGGEDVVARRPYEMPYTFSPTHKIWAVGNHKPRIKGTDHGIWRRMHLIPWLVTIPPEQRRPRHEMLASFRGELPGILNKALAGYGDFQQRAGLAPPKAVLAATEEYRQEEDSLANYITERLQKDPDGKAKVSLVLHDYLAWCKEGNGEPVATSARKFTACLKAQKMRVEAYGPGDTMHIIGYRMPGDSRAKFSSPVQEVIPLGGLF